MPGTRQRRYDAPSCVGVGVRIQLSIRDRIYWISTWAGRIIACRGCISPVLSWIHQSGQLVQNRRCVLVLAIASRNKCPEVLVPYHWTMVAEDMPRWVTITPTGVCAPEKYITPSNLAKSIFMSGTMEYFATLIFFRHPGHLRMTQTVRCCPTWVYSRPHGTHCTWLRSSLWCCWNFYIFKRDKVFLYNSDCSSESDASRCDGWWWLCTAVIINACHLLLHDSPPHGIAVCSMGINCRPHVTPASMTPPPISVTAVGTVVLNNNFYSP